MTNFRIRPLTIVLVVVAAGLIAIGIVYLTTTAGHLPSLFPGHAAHSSHYHVKHALAAFSLAVVALIGAWFTTAPDKSTG
jgi:hypothetical protein